MNIVFFLKSLRFLLLTIGFLSSTSLFAQNEKVKELEEAKVDTDFLNKYNATLRRMRRVYPLALEAAKLVRELDQELASVDSKRQKRKITKTYSKELKESYLYAIKDLYIEEGVLLMKLIHRETGKTVAEIVASYRGRVKSEFYDQLGRIWKQDLDATYDPKLDWITEMIIKQIYANEITFDFTLKKPTKEEYKKSMKVYRADRKAAKKLIRQRKRAASEGSEGSEE
jgi:hypothetical protein